MPRDHDALAVPVVRARHDRVTVAHDVEVRQLAQGELDHVGDLLLVQALRRDVDEVGGEMHDVAVQVETGHDAQGTHPSLSRRRPTRCGARVGA